MLKLRKGCKEIIKNGDEILDRSHQNLELDTVRRPRYLRSMPTLVGIEDSHVDLFHEIGGQLATAEGFHEVLGRVVEFASALVKCDSCLIYVIEGEDLVLRASKNAHPDVVDRLKLRVGQGITGWVAEHHEPVMISERAALDPRFQFFHELPEDSYEAFLSVPLMCRGRVVGAINLQHRLSHATQAQRDTLDFGDWVSGGRGDRISARWRK
jgi:uroporphyrinogen-III synthase